MKTTRLDLPYLMPDQAQKHVTVNEALRQLDMLVQNCVLGAQVSPPESPADGDAYLLSDNPTEIWAGHAGKIAIFVDEAWHFLAPSEGWRVWDKKAAGFKVYSNAQWHDLAQTITVSDITTQQLDHTITPGASNDTALVIAERDIVLGITARVMTALPSGQKWKLGVAADSGRYGTHIGGAQGSTNIGVSGQPQAYYSASPVRITVQSGTLSSGQIRLKLCVLRLTLPST